MATLSSRATETILSSHQVRLPFAASSAVPVLEVTSSRRGGVPAGLDEAGAKRRRLWELDPSLHCSIIGTCLTTAELREIVRRICRSQGLAAATASDHDVHGLGVGFAQRRDGPGKLLHKALDRRHAAALRAFAAATDELGVAARWREARAAGEIPGAYWATLTHAGTSERLRHRVFGEVHMLSHLVGASKRADIRRLSALEAQNAELQAQRASEHRRRRAALGERDARLKTLEGELDAALRDRPRPASTVAMAAPAEPGFDERLAALEARLAKAERGRAAAEQRCREALARLALERERRNQDHGEVRTLRAEVEALQLQLDALLSDAPEPPSSPAPGLGGARVLVVGARPAQVAHWRALVGRRGGEFLHHDGGVDDNIATLGGLVSRADLILFPVDCVSHGAMRSIKRLAAQQGKPWRALRTASLAAFSHALVQIDHRRSAAAC